MKKLFISLIMLTALLCGLLMMGTATAQTINVWYPVEKNDWKTVAWDAVTALRDGDPLPDPADAALSYNLYVKNVNTGVIIAIASGLTSLQQVVVLPKRARYLVGVEASLLYTGETEPVKSIVSWSSDSTVCLGGQTFGLKFQTGSQGPKNLK